jgi:LmbE family N-acetylglucosaminyl deacetylase
VSNRELPQEPELIPFEAGFPPGERWLFLGAHPDDETFGPGATLAQARDRGITVTVVVVTDGRAQGDPSVRAQEVRRATAALGLGSPELWNFVDRTLRPGDPELQHRLHQVFVAGRPDLVLVPSPVDLNIDHRGLALAVQRVLRRRTWLGVTDVLPRWVAAYEVTTPMLPNLLVAADAAWARKLAAATCYADQEAHRPYREVMEALGALRRLTLEGCSRAEALHVLPARRLACLSATGWAALMGPPRMVRVRSSVATSP